MHLSLEATVPPEGGGHGSGLREGSTVGPAAVGTWIRQAGLVSLLARTQRSWRWWREALHLKSTEVKAGRPPCHQWPLLWFQVGLSRAAPAIRGDGRRGRG